MIGVRGCATQGRPRVGRELRDGEASTAGREAREWEGSRPQKGQSAVTKDTLIPRNLSLGRPSTPGQDTSRALRMGSVGEADDESIRLGANVLRVGPWSEAHQ